MVSRKRTPARVRSGPRVIYDAFPNLQTQQFIDYAIGQDADYVDRSEWDSITGSGFEPLGSPKIDARQKPAELNMYSTRTYTFKVIHPKTNQRLFDTHINVPVEHKFEAFAGMLPWAKTTIPAPTKTNIRKGFDAFDPASGIDAESYLDTECQNNGIAPSDILIQSNWTIKRVSPAGGKEIQKKQIFDQLRHNIARAVGIESIRLEVLRVTDSAFVGPPPDDSSHQVSAPDSGAPAVADDLIEYNRDPDGDCGTLKATVPHKVAEAGTWIEFKLIWRPRRFVIGCFTFITSVPVMQTRTKTETMWAFAVYPDRLDNFTKYAVLNCVMTSAVAGAVAGIYTENWVVAKKVFVAIFTVCMKDKGGELLRCLSPDLFITWKTSDWSDI